MAYQLIALDMDGTLLGRHGHVSEQNRKWIAAALQAGKHVVLATGRAIGGAREYAELLSLDSPLVINNGSEVYRSPSVLHNRHVLESQWVVRLFDLIEPYIDSVRYWGHTVSGKIDNETFGPAGIDRFRETIGSLEWLQFAIHPDNPDILPGIRQTVESWNSLEISNSHPSNMEFNKHGINKASGLREVCGLLGIDIADTIAVGDSLNDVPMIRAAGLGVAMGNAQPSVKEAADAVAPTNLDDGVAEVIRTYLL